MPQSMSLSFLTKPVPGKIISRSVEQIRACQLRVTIHNLSSCFRYCDMLHTFLQPYRICLSSPEMNTLSTFRMCSNTMPRLPLPGSIWSLVPKSSAMCLVLCRSPNCLGCGKAPKTLALMRYPQLRSGRTEKCLGFTLNCASLSRTFIRIYCMFLPIDFDHWA